MSEPDATQDSKTDSRPKPQRRRRPREPRDDDDAISRPIREAYDLVPEIGMGYRWFDFPYNALEWLSSGWRRKLLPRRFREWTNLGLNYLIPFAEHQRNKVWSREDWMHNLTVPADEHVTVGGIWVVELFPPTEIPRLEEAIRRNGWDRRRRFIKDAAANLENLDESRSGSGPSWWRVADVVRTDSTWFVIDAVRSQMPPDFEVVSLRAIQVGAGLTAVLAHFTLSDAAAASVDETWHLDHEPMLVHRWGRPDSLNRLWAGIRRTQLARKALHDAARTWMSRRVPGFFASARRPHLSLDLMLFDRHDPSFVGRRATSMREPMRALGLGRYDDYPLRSTQLPKLVLTPPDSGLRDPMSQDPAWSLVGRRQHVADALGERLDAWGSDPDRAIANRLVDGMNNLLVMLSVGAWLDVAERRYASLRDRAVVRHGKFKPGAIRELRQRILTLSLDLATMNRDVMTFWKSPVWRWDGGAEFEYREAPDWRLRLRRDGKQEPEPENFNRGLQRKQKDRFRRLLAEDRGVRDILSTVASLGASADTFKMGRRALGIAFASLAVALATVMVSEIGSRSVISWLLELWQKVVG